MSFDDIWRVADARVDSGRAPGYVGAVRVRGHVEIHAAGRTAIDAGSPPMRTDTLFRIASVTKPIGGALVLRLIEDGIVALEDEVARWAPELAAPRVLRTRPLTFNCNRICTRNRWEMPCASAMVLTCTKWG